MRHLLRASHGAVIIEFAMFLPFIVLLFIGTIEIANYIYARQKISSAAANILNLINQQDSLENCSQLQVTASIVPGVVSPIAINENEYTVIYSYLKRELALSSTQQPIPFPYVFWQHRFGDNGDSRFSFQENNPAASEVTPASLDYVFREGDELMAVEVFLDYEPLFTRALAQSLFNFEGTRMYFYMTSRPRRKSFEFPPQDCHLL